MFNLTPRLGVTHVSQTNEYVGPNTYTLCTTRGNVNHVPFLSSEPRNPSFIQKLNSHAFYNIEANKRIKGGTSISNRARRFVYRTDGTPGPMRYSPKIKIPCKAPRPILGQGKLYFCRVEYNIAASAPSIPTRVDQNGYDLDAEGHLIKIPPDKPEMHQTFYQGSSLKTRYGCKWSGRTGKRFSVKYDDNPGPQKYDVQICKCLKYEADERYREMARLFSFIPRYIEAQELKARNNALPGPGYYDISVDQPLSSLRGRSINPRPFINKTERFLTKYSDTPSPGHYEVDINCLKCRKPSKKHYPFGFNASRFSQRKIEETPGPASYNIKGPMAEKLGSKTSSTINPPFNKTGERDMTFVSPDMFLTPAATDYPLESDDEDENEKRRIVHYSHMFSSCIKRFPKLCTKDKVSPATYNISDAFNKNCSRKSHNAGNVPFNSSGPRSSTFKQYFDNPGPADYNKKRDGDSIGYYFPVSPRFENSDNGKPGPGTYNIHPATDTSMHRAYRTHNVRLRQNTFQEVLKICKRSWKRRIKMLVAAAAKQAKQKNIKNESV